MLREISEAFNRADFPEVIRSMDRHFGESHYSLKSLFRDQQRKILDRILASTRQDLEGHYRQITDQYTPLMRFLKDIGAPPLPALKTAADFALNAELRRQFETDEPDPSRSRTLLLEAQTDSVDLQREALGYVVKEHIDRRMNQLASAPADAAFLARTAELAGIVREMNFELNLWKTENQFFRLMRHVAPVYREKAVRGDLTAQEWLSHFDKLGEQLNFRISAPEA